jgi:hypothetical protein
VIFLGVSALAVVALSIGDPSPPQAKANLACDIGVSPSGAVTGAIGIGNPVGDACAAITDPVLGVAGHVLGPLKDAAAGLGKGVFSQITTWSSDGAVWLLGRVVELTNKTTSPNLLSKGFLRQYRQMAAVAVVLAVLMLLFACLEGLGRGERWMHWRVFLVNVPVAALATSAAYVVVQLLIATTDGFSEAIAHSTAADTQAFFKGAVEALAEAGAGAGAVAGTAAGGAGGGTAEGAGAGAVAVPLFVGFIAAIVVAFAAFLVWIELLMRDAAIYAVALFMPMAIAASIWPRWTSALRRTAELLIVVVFSKFVIVAIIALAASLLASTSGKVEHVLAAAALLMLACFAPFVLFKLVPFAEGAVSSAYSRQSAGGVAMQRAQLGGSVAMMRRAANANWAGGSQGGGVAGGAGGGASKGRPGGSGGGRGSVSPGGASGGAAGAVALPVTAGNEAVKGTKAAAGKLASSGTAQASGDAGSGATSSRGGSADPGRGGGGERALRPRAEESASGGQASSSSSTSSKPGPTEALGGKAPGSGAKPPRPSGDVGAASKGSASGKEKP